MKSLRILFMSVAVCAGLATAVAGNRATTIYSNQANNGTYQRITTVNPSGCFTTTTIPCRYESPVDFGATATQTQLVSAGATSVGGNFVYHP